MCLPHNNQTTTHRRRAITLKTVGVKEMWRGRGAAVGVGNDRRAGRLTGRRRRTRRHARKRRRARSWRRALPHRAAERLWRRAGLRHFHMPAEDRALFTPGDSAEPPLGKLIIVEDNAICRGPVMSGPLKVQHHVPATNVVALGADGAPSTTTRRPGV